MPLGPNPTLIQIRDFFGGPGNLRAYYRGGPYVPNIAANANISTDPNSLRQTQFSYADKVTSPPVPNWGNASVSADIFVSGNGGGSNCYLEIRPNGMVYSYSSSNGEGNVYQWLPGGRSANEYMARRSTDGGNSWEGWQNLGSVFGLASASAYSDGFYSESDSQQSIVQIGYAGNVQATATFDAFASANGRG